MLERNPVTNPNLHQARHAVAAEINGALAEIQSTQGESRDLAIVRINRLEGMQEALKYMAGERSEVESVIAKHPFD